MTCESWKEPIALDAGGNLPAAEAAALRQHLHDCPSCQRFAAEMAASQDVLRRFSDRTETDESLARIRSAVLERLASESSGASKTSGVLRFPSGPRRAPRWLALAAGLIAALSLWHLNNLRPPPVETPPDQGRRASGEVAPPDLPRSAPPVAVPAQPAPALPVVSEARPRSSGSRGATPRRPTRPWRRPSLVEVSASSEMLGISPSVVVISESHGPLTSSPSLVVLPESSGPLTSSSSLTVLSATDPAPAANTIIFPQPPAPAGPTLRRISERNDHTIYWLDEPADHLRENEDADTHVL